MSTNGKTRSKIQKEIVHTLAVFKRFLYIQKELVFSGQEVMNYSISGCFVFGRFAAWEVLKLGHFVFGMLCSWELS